MSTKTKPGHTVRLTRTIKAPRARVFSAWTDPAEMKRWCAPEGYEIVKADVDLRVGGRYRIKMKSPDGTIHTPYGTYREVKRPEKLVYTWSWEESEHEVGETLVTVLFQERGESTEVVLMHEGFPTAEDRENHEGGWSSCLNRLERVF